MAIGVVGLIMGVMVSLGTEATPKTTNYIIIMSSGGYSIFGVFFKHCMITLLLYLLIFLAIFHRALSCVGYIVLFFLGYQFGGGFVAIIGENIALGIVFILIYHLPINLLMLGFCAVMVCCVVNHLHCHGAYRRCSIVCRNNLRRLLAKFGYAYLTLILLLIIFMIILPSIAQAIIVV